MTRGRLPAALILLLALGLRLWHLGHWSLDGDELYSWYDVQQILKGESWPPGAASFPLGYLMMAATTALLGASEWSLRLAPMFLGWLAVAALLVVRPDVGRTTERRLAALLAALSPWLIFHAQSARFYGPLLLFTTLATLWAWPGERRRVGLAWGALGLGVLCHPTALLLAPALLLAVGTARQRLRRLLGLLVLAAAGAGAVLLSADSSAFQVIDRWLTGADPGHYGAGRFLLGVGYNLGPEVGLAALLGWWAMRQRAAQEIWLLGSAVLLPAFLLLLAGVLGLSVHQRYLMPAVPALILVAAHGACQLSGRRVRIAIVGAVLLLPMPRLVAQLVDGSRHDTRAVAQFLAHNADPADLLLLEQHATIELYLHRQPRFADSETRESPVSGKKQHDLARQLRRSWLALKASHRQRPEEEAFHAWVDQVYTEVARVGRPPWALVQHDNQYVIYRRTRRLPPSEYGSPASNSPSSAPR